MTDILTSPTEAELFAAMEANYRAYFVGFACLPHMEWHADAEVSWFIARGAPGNNVCRTVTTAEQADATIERVLAHFGEQKVRSMEWQVLPSSQPADLGQRLLAHGLKPNGDEPFMLADLKAMSAEVNTPPNFRIELVRDEVMLREWYVASAAGFEASPEAARTYFDAYACLGFDPEGAWQHYIGYLGDEAVTSSTLLLADGIAGIFDVSTVPSARRQGLGGAITHAAMQEAQARGYRYATLQASPEGYEVYRKLGFEERFRRVDYLWQAKKEGR